MTRSWAVERPGLTVVIFEGSFEQHGLKMRTVELSAGHLHAAMSNPVSRAVDSVPLDLSVVDADIVIWDVSPATLRASDAFLGLLRQGAFGGRGLVVMTTNEPLLRALLGAVANDLVIVQKTRSVEALILELEYLAWTRLGRACGGCIDSHLRGTQYTVH